ncbi:centromere DNA-binding protein complex CBF3 subunit [Hirsutella rhossiliensis]|uniref:Centromere DNA-binding protein complex CBF3 subunit n=1 Tax=Hirsutella rhossiliensis TaxID=111463 RepID=A0A9P8MQF2_9HYPO|nr:centromere DNA-binding protein complex CBF3 subunit [Hirsutella rhossiliensis]KAH0959395.1 centromere DNA-binding protein complex CBF3 subunit [Hirsutella rhossiliensis]
MSNAIEDPRVRAAIEHYLLDLENTQPKNTKRNYRPKQEEWKEWCQANWPAIPDVWPASVPQGQQLPGDLVDEGKLLLFMKETQSTIRYHRYARPHQRGMVREREIACALRTQVDFLLGNHMLLRSGNRLPMELADCFPWTYPTRLQGPGYTTKALVVVMNCGKTNQHGRMEKAERFPVFQRSEDWYETKVLRRSAKEPQAPLSGQTAREWTSRFYKKAGIKVSKVSHAPRVAATQNADMAGVDEGQIRRAGRWNNGDQMTGCYLTSCLSIREAVADFDPEWSGSYFVPGPP